MSVTTINELVQLELNKDYELLPEQREFFRNEGYIRIKNFLSDDLIKYYNQIITEDVEKHQKISKAKPTKTAFDKAFIQIFNLWLQNTEIRSLVFSLRITKLISNLMGVAGLRLYHEQALFKEPDAGITPWHRDQAYWPVDGSNICTIWMPLQRTSLEMGPLEFAKKSHRALFKEPDSGISDSSEKILADSLKDFDVDMSPYEIGEISIHYGKTFHRANGNQTSDIRKAIGIIYFEDGMCLKKPDNFLQQMDRHLWVPGGVIGEPIATHLNPLVYKASS